MKSFAFAFLAIIAGATALPQNNDVAIAAREERLVAGAIVAAIEAAAQGIRDAGLDPVIVDNAQVNYVSPLGFVELSAFLDSLELVGLSNIAINNMDYSVLASRLRFDVSLPEIRLAVGNSGLSVALFGANGNANCRGSLAVKGIRLNGEVRVNVGIISGIGIRDLSLNLSLGGIESNITLNILDRDLSRLVNTLLNVIIPDFLANNQATINHVLESIVWEVIDRIL